jgi:hypothetical protein
MSKWPESYLEGETIFCKEVYKNYDSRTPETDNHLRILVLERRKEYYKRWLNKAIMMGWDKVRGWKLIN